MSADGDLLASFLVVGANHRSSSLAVRERLLVADDGVPAFMDRLRRARTLSQFATEMEAIGQREGIVNSGRVGAMRGLRVTSPPSGPGR